MQHLSNIELNAVEIKNDFHIIYMERKCLLPYEIIFKTVDEPGEEIMRIFSKLCEVYP